MSKKEAFKAVSLLSAATFLGAGCAFLTQVILARKLGSAAFGTFSAALTTVTLLTPLAGFGISQFWLKAFGQEGWAARRWFQSSFSFIVLSTILVLTTLIAWSFVGPHDGVTSFLVVTLSVHVLGQAMLELVSSKLQLEERYLRLAFWQLLPHLMRLVLIMLLAFVFSKLTDGKVVAFVYAAISIIIAIMGSIQLKNMWNGKFDLKGHPSGASDEERAKPSMASVVSEAWPFGMAGLFHLIYFQSSIILLKYITGPAAAGMYNVALTVMTAVYLLPSVIFQKYLLPKTHRWANHDRLRFYQVYRQGNLLMLVLGALAMICIWASAFWAIPILFGAPYRGAVLLLNILAVSAPIFFIAISVGSTLVTQDHMRMKVRYMGFVAILNVFLNLVLIPRFGAAGSAIATVVSNLALLISYYNFSQKIVFHSELKAAQVS